MLRSKKIKIISLLIKAIGSFVSEIGEIVKLGEEDQEIIQIHESDARRIAAKIKEIELDVETEITKYPKNQRLKNIKEKLDDIKRDGNQIIKNAKFNR